MNVCTFIGRLGKDPEMKYTNNGKAVVSFSLAVNRDGKKDQTDWIEFVAWEKTAEIIAQHCNKGDLLGVTGNLQRREWEKDGQKRYAHEIKVNRIDFCGGKKGEAAAPAADEDRFVPIEDESELPF